MTKIRRRQCPHGAPDGLSMTQIVDFGWSVDDPTDKLSALDYIVPNSAGRPGRRPAGRPAGVPLPLPGRVRDNISGFGTIQSKVDNWSVRSSTTHPESTILYDITYFVLHLLLISY